MAKVFIPGKSSLGEVFTLKTGNAGYAEERAKSYPPSKRMRKFKLTFGLPDNEHGRSVIVEGRSNFEAGFNALRGGVIPSGYVAHSLIEVPGRV